MRRKEAVLNNLPGKLYSIEANDKIPHNCKHPLVPVQNQKQTNTRGSGKMLKLKIGAEVMWIVNVDIQEN